jgi:hypothetical protein
MAGPCVQSSGASEQATKAEGTMKAEASYWVLKGLRLWSKHLCHAIVSLFVIRASTFELMSRLRST